MKIILFILSIFLFATMNAQTKMTIPEIKAFVTDVVKQSQSIRTIQTDFTQIKTMEMMNKPIVSTGKMAIQMPNTLSWKYVTPSPITVISKDNKLFVDNKGKQSTFDAKSKMFEKINKLMVGSANGSMFTDPDFSVIYMKDGSTNIARFLPKNKQLAKYVKQLELYFPVGKPTVSQVKMTDSGGGLTTISFKNTKINEAIPASAFTF